MSDDDHRWVVLLVPTGRAADEALVRRHCAHLERLEAQGALALAGPFDDGTGGMLVLQGLSESQARAAMAADPFVAEGVRAATLRGWSLSRAENNHMGMGSGHSPIEPPHAGAEST